MPVPLDLLMSSSLLASLGPTEILPYLTEAKIRIASYTKSAIIHLEGDRCDHLDIVLSGQVAIQRIDADGGLVTVAELVSDDLMGGNHLFAQNPYYPMTVVARRPCVIAQIDRQSLFELLCRNPGFLRSYLQHVSDNAALLGNRIRHYAHRPLRDSLLNFLSAEALRQGTNRIELRMTKKALAEKLGVQRTSISRELAKMQKAGLVQVDGASITLLQQ